MAAALDSCGALIVHPEHVHTLPLEPLRLSFWEACCDAVLHKIAGGTADARSLAALMLVNSRCRRVASCDQLWRALCIATFNTPPQLSHPGMTWREVYRFNHEALRWLLAQTAAEAMAKLGIRPAANRYAFAAAAPRGGGSSMPAFA